jgi:CRISPR type IV-associated protein Csf1
MELTSSVIIATAMGLGVDEGVEAPHEGVCALCGKTIHKGELHSPKLGLNSGFMDDLDMAARGSLWLCKYCVQLKTAVPLRESGFGVFSEEGVRPFCKWADVGNSLLRPPQPPFCMTYATGKNQHMAWRTPISFERDVYYVRVGNKDLRIRRQKLFDAIEHCRVLGEAIYPPDPKKKSKAKPKTKPNPFLGLSPDLKDPSHGRLNPKVHGPEFEHLKEHVDALLELTQGEIWGLRFVLSVDVDHQSQE